MIEKKKEVLMWEFDVDVDKIGYYHLILKLQLVLVMHYFLLLSLLLLLPVE